jgi:uncharacterized protein (TIGR01244 family)
MRDSMIRRTTWLATTVFAGAVLAQDAGVLASLPNHRVVSERLHVSAQPSAEALKALPGSGVRAVIDLRPDAETPELDEKAVVEGVGMKYRSLPIAGKADLTQQNVATFDQLLKASESEKVLVHCASGNRVGALMALRARWLQGKSAEESLAIGKAAGLSGLTEDVKALVNQDAVSSASPAWPPK